MSAGIALIGTLVALAVKLGEHKEQIEKLIFDVRKAFSTDLEELRADLKTSHQLTDEQAEKALEMIRAKIAEIDP